MRFLFLVIISGFVLFSCKMDSKTPVAVPVEFDKVSYGENLKKEREKQEAKKTPSPETQADSLRVKKENPDFTETTDTLQVKFVYGKALIDTVKLPRQKWVFLMNSDTAHKIRLKISTTDSLANLRISQIEDSEGNSDGPFGREVEYQILEKGLHRISVSESKMQGEAWGGKFRFEAQLIW